MIKPYLKHEHTANIVEVEDFGIINLNDLPIKVHLEKEGRYEICWALQLQSGKDTFVLSEAGGSNAFNYGGRNLGVIRELE